MAENTASFRLTFGADGWPAVGVVSPCGLPDERNITLPVERDDPFCPPPEGYKGAWVGVTANMPELVAALMAGTETIQCPTCRGDAGRFGAEDAENPNVRGMWQPCPTCSGARVVPTSLDAAGLVPGPTNAELDALERSEA